MALHPNTKQYVPRIEALFGKLFPYLANDDSILKTKSSGKNYDFYDEIVDKDAVIRSCLQTRKHAVRKLGYQVMPYLEEGRTEPKGPDLKVAQAMRTILRRMRNFSFNVKESLSAYEHGFSVSEIMYRIDPDFVVVSDMLHRQPGRFEFGADNELIYRPNLADRRTMPPEKFFVYSFEPRYENLYGTSLLRTAYWAHWFGSNLAKFLLIYSERFGQPTITAQYPKGFTNEEKETLLAQLEAVQNDSRGIIPEGSVVDFLEAVKDNQAMFRASMEYFDDYKRLTILGQTLTSSDGGGTGSYALGKVHGDVRDDILAGDAEDMGSALTEQIVGPLMVYNFPSVKNFPRIVLPFKPPADLQADSNVLKNLVSVGVKIPSRYAYEHFQIPRPEEGEEILEAPPVQSPFGPIDNAPDNRPGADDKPDDKEGDEDQVRPPDKKLSARRFKLKKLSVKMRAPEGQTFDIGSVSRFYDEMYAYMGRLLAELKTELSGRIIIGAPMEGLIDQAIRSRFGNEFSNHMAEIVNRAVAQTAYDFARQFGQVLHESTFRRIQAEYIRSRFYEKGALRGIGEAIRDILSSKLTDAPLDYAEVKKILKDTFAEMADWKAHQIAQTEVMEAANYTAFEMIGTTGLEMEAWFLVDPASCEICQDWAAASPYTVDQAREMGLPHIQCNDQWTFALKEGKSDE